MQTQVTIKNLGATVLVVGPYSPVLNETFRSRGGVFDRGRHGWLFPNRPAVWGMIEALYGEFNNADSNRGAPLVRVRIPDGLIEKAGQEWLFHGYQLAFRRGRDERVKMPEGVALEDGRWSSTGGSVANPRVSADGRVELSAVVFETFASREGLEILQREEEEEGPAAWVSPLANFSDAELLAECQRRGLVAPAD